jgi:hypothetical protein
MGIVTDTLGTAVSGTGDYTDVEVGKGVKMGAAAYVPVVAGDELEGIVNSVEPGVRNTGYSWGGIQTKGRALAVVGAAQSAAMAVGDLVCCSTPLAKGTAGLVKVQSDGTGYAAPAFFVWRCIRIVSGTGAAGDTVLIERV